MESSSDDNLLADEAELFDRYKQRSAVKNKKPRRSHKRPGLLSKVNPI